jgi:hypothetical protein
MTVSHGHSGPYSDHESSRRPSMYQVPTLRQEHTSPPDAVNYQYTRGFADDSRSRANGVTATAPHRSPEAASFISSRSEAPYGHSTTTQSRDSADYFPSSTDRYAIPTSRRSSVVSQREFAPPRPVEPSRNAYPPTRPTHYSLPMRDEAALSHDHPHYTERNRLQQQDAYAKMGGYQDAQPTFFMPSHYDYQQGKTRKRSNLPKQSTEIMKTWFDQVNIHTMVLEGLSADSIAEHHESLPFRGAKSSVLERKQQPYKQYYSIANNLCSGNGHQHDPSQQLVHQPPPSLSRTTRQARQDTRRRPRRQRLRFPAACIRTRSIKTNITTATTKITHAHHFPHDLESLLTWIHLRLPAAARPLLVPSSQHFMSCLGTRAAHGSPDGFYDPSCMSKEALPTLSGLRFHEEAFVQVQGLFFPVKIGSPVQRGPPHLLPRRSNTRLQATKMTKGPNITRTATTPKAKSSVHGWRHILHLPLLRTRAILYVYN